MKPCSACRGGAAALWVAIVVLILAVVILFAAVAVKRKMGKKIENKPDKTVVVVTRTVEARSVGDVLSLPARVRSEYEADVAVPKAGIVIETPAERGQRIERDQVLLRLDATTWMAMLRRAEVELREAGKDLARAERLKSGGAISDSDLDAVRMRFDLALVGRDDASNQVAKCELRSPVAGTVVDRYAEVGEFAAEGARAFRLVQTDVVKIVFELPERETGRIREGAEALFATDAAPGCIFTGKVAFIAAAAHPANNAFPAEVRGVRADGVLKPGMIGKISLYGGDNRAVISLPIGAVIPRKGGYSVFVVENGRAFRRIVQIERISGEDLILGGGIQVGDEVVIEGGRSLSDNTEVKVQPAGDGQAAGGGGKD